MIPRKKLFEVKAALDQYPICYLAGPRQVGKTTMARQLLKSDHPAYFDLEDPASLARLRNPKTVLNQHTPLTVIDEIQIRPDLFPILRVLSDSEERNTSWLVLGSASPAILKGVSESLAGRVKIIQLSGFSLAEIGMENQNKLQLRGGFPRSFLADTDYDSADWRKEFIHLIVSRDIPQLGVGLQTTTLMRLFTMMAHYHGQIWNAAEPARSLGVSETTIHRLTDFFEGLYYLHQLRPWHANIAKRQVKRPKIFIRDSGIACSLLGIKDYNSLLSHPKAGTVWEGFVIEEIIKRFPHDNAWFWATHTGAELDLLLEAEGKKIGIEIKLSDAPSVTRSMRTAIKDLDLDILYVVHGGPHSWEMDENIHALPLSKIPESLR